MVRMDENMPFLLQYENVAWYENGKVRILDRRIYPTEVRFVECATYQEVVQAIADMVTQSAGPYTAVGMGMALAAWQVRDKGAAEQDAFLQQAAYDLAHARPTTANRYGQITYRCAEVAKEALAAGKDPVQAIVENTVESLNRRYSDPVLRGNHHRHRDPGRPPSEQGLQSVLRRDPALSAGGAADLRLLRPDGL